MNHLLTNAFFVVWPIIPILGALFSLWNLREAVKDWKFGIKSKYGRKRMAVIQSMLIQEAICLVAQCSFSIFNVVTTAQRTDGDFSPRAWFFAIVLLIVSIGFTAITINSWYIRRLIFR